MARTLEHTLGDDSVLVQAAEDVAAGLPQIGIKMVVAAFLTAAQRHSQRIVTESMMTIELPPNKLLRLGNDLSKGFPAILQKIDNPDLQALLAKIDPTPDNLEESGAQYWGDLADRLHFIADMFRCYQMSPELLDPPFMPGEVPD